MHSLKIKILIITTIIMGMAVGLTIWQGQRVQTSMLNRLVGRNGRILGETLRDTIITNLTRGRDSEVTAILKKVQREPSVEAARIFDRTGTIIASADHEEIGRRISAPDYLAFTKNQLSFSQNRSYDYQSTLVPIYAKTGPGKSGKLLGVLNLHLSLKDIGALKAQGQGVSLLPTLGMQLLLGLAVILFVMVYVEIPLRKLIGAMNHVEQGDFEKAAVDIRNSEEMTLLSTKFNRMVHRLRDLIETTVRHEREIAVNHQKLAHHDEIRAMNLTLEERLEENQHLNIALEERIEEIEEANYKIADLFSDLESKNRNLRQVISRLSALSKIGLDINAVMDLEKLFPLLVRRTVDTLEAKVGYILLLDQQGTGFTIGSALGTANPIVPGYRVPLKAGGVSHWVVTNREPLLIRTVDEQENIDKISHLGFERKSVVCAPLIIKEEMIGTITVANKKDETPFTPEDLELLSTIASQASVAINNARLYEEQQTTYLSTVQALVSTIEASDPYTSGHSERVTAYSLAVARRLGLDSEALIRLEQAAILHDIGKIGVDVRVLHKQGQLSTEDIGILRRHPLIGFRILEPIKFLNQVREIIKQHHERFDGKGYPHGLGGENLLIEARILTVADAFDAMTSDRPYHRALSYDTAIIELKDKAGSQFDPKVVRAFVSLWDEGDELPLAVSG